MNDEMKQILIDVESSVKMGLQHKAQEAGLSMSAYVRSMLQEVTLEDVEKTRLIVEIEKHDKKLVNALAKTKGILSQCNKENPLEQEPYAAPLDKTLREVIVYQEKIKELVSQLAELELTNYDTQKE